MKVKNLTKFFVVISLLFCFSGTALAAHSSKPLPGESRFRYWTYQPNTFYKYIGFLKVASRIDLDPSEKIINMTMGDPTGWVINPSGHRIFIKPTQLDISTHMTLITDKRIYYFELEAQESADFKDKDIAIATSFLYADGSEANSFGSGSDLMNFSEEQQVGSYVPDPIKDAAMLNFNYTKSGAENISPIEVFDDGEFTYFKFNDINAQYPAIFEVLPDGNESLINFRIAPNGYLVIEMVTSQFTLRYGNELACVFNEKKPLKRVKDKNKNTTFFGIF
jgi:type IV secretion system protein VirB9